MQSIIEAAVCLSFMIIPERIYSPYNSFLMQTTLRSEDYRKLWWRKSNLQLVAVVFGAALGGIPTLLDRYIPPPYPYWVLDGAVISSTAVNLISFYFF